MKFNFKVCVLNGLKGALLLLLLAGATIFIYKFLSYQNVNVFFLVFILIIIDLRLSYYILFKVIHRMDGYSDDPDWDIEANVSTLISIFIFMIIIFSVHSIYTR